jgi:SWI/SNF-related matrix-associated actin-dependent regulator 1 of chromatin subfamily A
VEKFQEGKFLGTELLNSAQDVLRARHVVQALMKKCTKLAAQMERAIAAGASSVKKQPPLLSPRSVHNLTCIVSVLNSDVYGSLSPGK